MAGTAERKAATAPVIQFAADGIELLPARSCTLSFGGFASRSDFSMAIERPDLSRVYDATTGPECAASMAQAGRGAGNIGQIKDRF